VLGALTLIGPWLQVKPNRIVEGTSRSLAFDDGFWGAVCLGLWALPLLVSVFSKNPRTPARAAWAIFVMVPVVVLLGSGAVASALVPDGSFVRVSPSWSFWITILGCYAGALVLGPLTELPRSWLTLGKAVFPAACLVGLATGAFAQLSLLKEFVAQSDVFWDAARIHLILSGVAVLAGTLLGTLTGWGAHRLVQFRRPAFFFLNLVQTLPSLALFGLLIVPLAALGLGGIGPTPALVALALYAAFPIARSTLTAFDHLDAAVLDAGRGLGMGRAHLFFRVQFPLALPVVLEGVRTASVQAVGNTVVAALIGAGGLGSLVFLGLGQYAPDLILLGTLPVVVLALAVDLGWVIVLGLLNRRVRT